MLKEQLEKCIYDQFFKQREALIRKLEANELSKSEYIEETYLFIKSLNMMPSKGSVNSCEEGLYSYQYYNMLAKYYRQKAQELKYRDPFKAKDYRDLVEKYYKEKDKVTLGLLDLLNYKDVEGYFVHIKSRNLRGRLIEIVLKNYDLAVLHTMNERVLKNLRKGKVFKEGQHKSVIDDYINTKYY